MTVASQWVVTGEIFIVNVFKIQYMSLKFRGSQYGYQWGLKYSDEQCIWYGCEKQKVLDDQKYLTYHNTVSQQNLTSLYMNTKGQSLNG